MSSQGHSQIYPAAVENRFFLRGGEIKSGSGLGMRLATHCAPYEEVTKTLSTAWSHRKRTNSPYPGCVASRLSIINFVAMVMPINMTILSYSK